MESLTSDLVSDASAHFFPDNTLSCFSKRLREQMNRGAEWKVALVRTLLLETRHLPFHYGICESHEHAQSGETRSHRKLYRSQSKDSRKTKKLIFSWQMKDRVLHSLVQSWVEFLEANVPMTSVVVLRKEGPHQRVFVYGIVRIHSLLTGIEIIECNITGEKNSIEALLCNFFSGKSCVHYNYWTKT